MVLLGVLVMHRRPIDTAAAGIKLFNTAIGRLSGPADAVIFKVCLIQRKPAQGTCVYLCV